MAVSDRRSFLTSAIATVGVAVNAGRADFLAARPHTEDTSKKFRIDAHHHFAPPTWVEAMKGHKLLQVANTTWTAEKSLEDMDRGGASAALISITNPGLYLGDQQQTNRLARECNDFGAKVVQDHPTRFGLFAAMPLPDVGATLKEIAYAYDQIHAVGIGFMGSFGDTWLATPTTSRCLRNSIGATPSSLSTRPQPIAAVTLTTTRFPG